LISITRNASERSVRIIHPDRVSPRKTTVVSLILAKSIKNYS